MYPIYPVLIYGSVITVDLVLSYIVTRIATIRHQHSSSSSSPSLHTETNTMQNTIRRWKSIGHVGVWLPIILLSCSRTYALYKYYHAPLDVYQQLSSTIMTKTIPSTKEGQYGTTQNMNDRTHLVCTCGEWYRYMTSFHLPEGGSVPIPIGFLPSSFQGQLPQPFTPYGSTYESLPYVQPFNDQNAEVTARYVNQVQHCQYLIDVSDSNDCRSQFLNVPRTKVIPLYAVPFLDADRTASVLHRILFIPYLHEQAQSQGRVVYKNYTLYQIETTLEV